MWTSGLSVATSLVFNLLVGCAPVQTPLANPPIILISLDTFRADRMGVLGNPDGLTPNLDAFAAESTLFEHAYSQACNTKLSHGSMFTSRYPSEQINREGTNSFGAENPLYPQILNTYGYQTGAFVGGADLAPEYGLSVAFETYQSPKLFGSLYHTVPLALQWLDNRDKARPYFAFIHGYDTHSNYLRPQPYGFSRMLPAVGSLGHDALVNDSNRIVDGRYLSAFPNWLLAYATVVRPRSATGRIEVQALLGDQTGADVTEADIAYVRAAYDGAVTYGDTMFGLLMAALAQRGVLDEAMIVVMSDHGEELGEHGIFWHDFGLEDEENHVPLMIRMPGGKWGGHRVSEVVELVDLMPTLLEAAGAVAPVGMQGISLMPAVRGEPFAGHPAAFTESSPLSRMFSARGATGRLTFSGLHSSMAYTADVLEAARIDGPAFTATEGLSAAEREGLRTQMQAWLASLRPVVRQQAPEIPEALKQSMREHGYFDAGQR
jgi:membrane-anchored protein YejM (alkaline phosphatase superfamily)